MPSVRPKTPHITRKTTQENPSSSPKMPNTPNTLKTKISSSAGLFRLFSKGSTNVSKQELSSTSDNEGRQSVSVGLREIGLEVETCNFIRPQGLKLEPRNETTASRSPSSCYRPRIPEIIPPVPDVDTALKSINSLSQSPAPVGGLSSRRGLPQVIVNSHLTVDANMANSKFPPGSPLMSPVSPIHETGLPAFASLQGQFVVGRIAKNLDSMDSWTAWLKSYSNGEFNIQNPPKPPPLSESFSHLPAVCPSNEERRRILSARYDLAWDENVQKRVGVHIRAAMEKLGTRYAAMSFFDDDYEIFKAENGYNVPRIQRCISIAAHALYTTEVLSIVDMTKDWRFQNNPMVTGKPRIRFFAAAPMVSTHGEILGVLSIFSRDPRQSFSHDQRRLLADCSAVLMAEMNDHLEQHAAYSPSFVSAIGVKTSTTKVEANSQSKLSPCSDCSSVTSHSTAQARARIPGQELENIHLVPPPLRFHKLNIQSNVLGRILTENSSNIRSTGLVEHTPPSSVESSQGTIFGESQSVSVWRKPCTSVETRTRSENAHAQSVSPPSSDIRTQTALAKSEPTDTPTPRNENASCFENMSYSPEGYRQPSPNSYQAWIDEEALKVEASQLSEAAVPLEDYRSSSPRPFSSSDITSINPLPPNSPNQSPTHHDLSHHPTFDITVADFMSLSDGDISEKSYEPLPEGKHPPETEQIHYLGSPNIEDRGKTDVADVISTSKNHDVSRAPDAFHLWKFPRPDSKPTGKSSPIKLRRKDNLVLKNKSCSNSRSSSDCSIRSDLATVDLNGMKALDKSEDMSSNCHLFLLKKISDPLNEIDKTPNINDLSPEPTSNFRTSIPQAPSANDSRRPSLALSTASSISRRRISKETISQAAFTLASSCKQMGYSLMYIAKVNPRVKDTSRVSESELMAPEPRGLSVQILTAYGLADAVELCPLIHLRVLRSRGPTSWEDYNDKGEFQKGMLMVIRSEGGPLRSRSRGLILGAFRNAQPGQPSSPEETAAESHSLNELAKILKTILMTSKSSQSPQGPRTVSGSLSRI